MPTYTPRLQRFYIDNVAGARVRVHRKYLDLKALEKSANRRKSYLYIYQSGDIIIVEEELRGYVKSA